MHKRDKTVLMSLCMGGLLCATNWVSAQPRHSAGTGHHYRQQSHSAVSAKDMNLILGDAIVLALHYNPAIESIHMNQVLERFNWRVLRDTFRPHFTMAAHTDWNQGEGNSYSVSPTATVTTPLGTTISTSYNQGFAGQNGSLGFEVKQPLLNGFRQPHYQYEDTKAGLISQKMTDEDNISQQIESVITSYRSLVEKESNLKTQEEDVKEAQINLDMIKLKVKAGQTAPSEVIQQESSMASTKLSIIHAKQKNELAHEKFLQNIGINPDTQVKLTSTLDTKQYILPNKKQTEAYALAHNHSYRQAIINVSNTARKYKESINSTKWKLDLDAQDNEQVNVSHSNLGASMTPQGNRSVGVDFSAPIHSLTNGQTRLSAKIAVQNSELSLRTARRELINSVDTQLNGLALQIQNINQSKEAIRLAQINLNNYILKFKYGQVPQYEVDNARHDLLKKKLSLTNAKIEYLNQLTTLRQLTGKLLPHWNINIRGSHQHESA